MASIRLYGNPAHRGDAERVLASFGAEIQVDNGTPDSEILHRVLSHDHARRPDLLTETLVVRGRSYIVSNDPARLQSLMY